MNADRCQMARDDFAECHVDEVAILVDDGVERIEFTNRAHDLELLLVQRVADEVALDGERVLHEAGGVEGADRRVAGNAGRHDFAAAGPAGHEMRLDQAGGDAQIGLDQDRRLMLIGVPRVAVGPRSTWSCVSRA